VTLILFRVDATSNVHKLDFVVPTGRNVTPDDSNSMDTILLSPL
jgi:hypothetical protein